MNKVIVMSLIASMMLFNMGCDESDVEAGIVGVGVGLGVAAIASDHHDHDRHRDDWGRGGGYPGYGPGYGRGGGWDHGRRGGYGRYSAETKLDVSGIAGLDKNVDAFAEKYHITADASAKIQDAFTAVGTQGTASFQTIGLTRSDLKQIAKREMPASESLKLMAQKLDLSEAQSRDLVQSMITEFDHQASDVNSTYWKSCMAKGKWKTAQNNYCSNTAWNGCSPITGATLCY